MDFGVPELTIILFVVLLLFGPGRIVKVGHELGEGIRQFKHGLETPPESERADENKSTDG
jgi:sec-independent protein translocase protein TatA